MFAIRRSIRSILILFKAKSGEPNDKTTEPKDAIPLEQVVDSSKIEQIKHKGDGFFFVLPIKEAKEDFVFNTETGC